MPMVQNKAPGTISGNVILFFELRVLDEGHHLAVILLPRLKLDPAGNVDGIRLDGLDRIHDVFLIQAAGKDERALDLSLL